MTECSRYEAVTRFGITLPAVAYNTVLVAGTLHIVAVVVVEIDNLCAYGVCEAYGNVDALEGYSGIETSGEVRIWAADNLAVVLGNLVVAIGIVVNHISRRQILESIVRNSRTLELVSGRE